MEKFGRYLFDNQCADVAEQLMYCIYTVIPTVRYGGRKNCIYVTLLTVRMQQLLQHLPSNTYSKLIIRLIQQHSELTFLAKTLSRVEYSRYKHIYASFSFSDGKNHTCEIYEKCIFSLYRLCNYRFNPDNSTLKTPYISYSSASKCIYHVCLSCFKTYLLASIEHCIYTDYKVFPSLTDLTYYIRIYLPISKTNEHCCNCKIISLFSVEEAKKSTEYFLYTASMLSFQLPCHILCSNCINDIQLQRFFTGDNCLSCKSLSM